MDKAIIGVLLIAIIAIVSATRLAYYVVVKSYQTQNTPSPTPTPIPEQTPTPNPPVETSADLVVAP